MQRLSNKNIKNIIFDLGGVILNIAPEQTNKAFKKLGVINFEEVCTLMTLTKLFDKLETGVISHEQFRDEIRALTHLSISNKEIDDAWNAMILDFPEKRINLLERLKKQYRTFLLSNTNEIHYHYFSNILKQQHGYNNLSKLFERTYYSFRETKKKPDADFFLLVLNQNNLNPKETLFIDDFEKNVKGAEITGINSYLIKPDKDITELLRDF